MSNDGNVRRRPDLWSYISFSAANSRRSSFSLPSHSSPRKGDADRYDKPHSARAHSASISSNFGPVVNARPSRYLKLGGGLFLLAALFYLLTSRGPTIIHPGHSSPAITTKCTVAHDPTKPVTQYALMVDAGSTGSRIHVYRFNNCGPTPELEHELFKQTAKRAGGSGLSSYDSDAEGAAASLDVLLDAAVAEVPSAFHSCSPIAVKATAGLRKLGEQKSQRILAAVRTRLETKYPFPLLSAERGGVEVMDGTDEGVYAWITTNYLLGKIGGPDKRPTAAVFDLGGGSTQIVFEPTFGPSEKMRDGEHKYELAFAGHSFDLYQHSYLGYGLMEARNKLNRLVYEQAAAGHGAVDRAWLDAPLVNPCFAPGTAKPVSVELDGGDSVKVNMTGPLSGSAPQCRALAEKSLRKDAECKLLPCAFNGVHQPSLATTFAKEDVYLFSYFYDRTQPLGMPDSFSLAELAGLTGKVCAGESAWADFEHVPGAMDELRDRPDHCMDLSFMLALLHTGYELPMDRTVRIAKKIKGNELGWCLGASLPLLSQESGWQCKIKQVA